jgi:hypothetical protein
MKGVTVQLDAEYCSESLKYALSSIALFIGQYSCLCLTAWLYNDKVSAVFIVFVRNVTLPNNNTL